MAYPARLTPGVGLAVTITTRSAFGYDVVVRFEKEADTEEASVMPPTAGFTDSNSAILFPAHSVRCLSI